ncbi:uncharacterized protein BXZ73DRAFT_91620 [Epithele typhae]|uniref:uncharacterized protein n=1 Tax=Epithele typhae TaxID=378194 RepID=UPI0020082F86|nr:uncharacterized protein BXZ73DRAFT_91620 [Epithele typhae]KAH9922333.1 hypothetical protein BXZ73DRAFT_91620 [Epithele typhae]
MPSHNDDVQRPARQRANTSILSFGWRRGGRPEPSVSAPAPPLVSSPLQWEDLIQALTPPAVPSLSYAKSLASALGALGTHSPPPRLSVLQPVLATLCAPDSPPALQTAGYDILAAFLESGPTIVSTADRLSCLALFHDAPWLQELWDSRTKAFKALIKSAEQTIGMESQILRMLESWTERAFDGLVSTSTRLERQRSVETLIALLNAVVRKPELVARLTDEDTMGVLQHWERLLDKALAVPSDLRSRPPLPLLEPQSSKTMTPPKLPIAHRRHHSSTSLPKLSLLKHPADLIPAHSHQNSLEQRISVVLAKLVGGPYASACKLLMKRHFFPSSEAGFPASVQTSTGALRTLRLSVRGVLESRLARAYIEHMSSVAYSPAGLPAHLAVERGLMERAWAKDETSAWELTRFANVLSRATRAWISQIQEVYSTEVAPRKEDVLLEIAAIVKDVIQAMEERSEGEEVDDEEVEAVGRITRELAIYVRSQKTANRELVPISILRPEGSSPFLTAITPLFPVLPSIILSVGDHLPDADLCNRQSFSPTSFVLSLSKQAMGHLQSVWEFVKDIPAYRKPLATLVFDVWKRHSADELEDSSALVAVLRLVEKHACEAEPGFCEDILNFLLTLAREARQDDEDDAASIMTVDPSTATTSPTLSRMTTVTDHSTPSRENPNSFMNLISSFTTAMPSRSTSKPRRTTNEMPAPIEISPPLPSDPYTSTPRSVGAVIALVSVFTQLVFTHLALSQCSLRHAKRAFQHLVELSSGAGCVRARLVVLQFLMRLRVDRDHRLYFALEEYDKDGHVASLAALVGRAELGQGTVEDMLKDDDFRRPQARVPGERDGRRSSRGRGGQPRMDGSRSRSRVPAVRALAPTLTKPKAREPMWALPEVLSLSVAASDVASEGMMSYDPASPGQGDSHLFCGPRSKKTVSGLLAVLCTGLSEGTLGRQIERWPEGIISRDAQGLAFHTLTVLISYQRCFENAQPCTISSSGQPSTQKCCLHALSLCAFELQPSMTKYLSRIMEKLSQIISNPAVAVHIIDFLAIVGSQRALYVNFNESDFKMHVRIMSYYITYEWFLAVDMPDRHRHVSYIVRQLLLANGGKGDVDAATEVAFDWLARYTYASADPRPSTSTLDSLVMDESLQAARAEPALGEKTWILGNSIVTIRALAKRGWIEVLSRRPSGLTKFLVRSENVPMVPLGDVDPDLVSLSAMFMMDREDDGDPVTADDSTEDLNGSVPTLPDPITGYVWSRSAPSQRRKEVALIYLRGQVDYAYAWWDDIGQILFHTATLMPTGDDPRGTAKKAHIGNDLVRIVWNDSGKPYRFDTLKTQFQFVNVHEYFKVTLQRAPGMVEFTPIGDFKLISAENLPKLVRQVSLLSDWFVSVWQATGMNTRQEEVVTNWRARLDDIRRFRDQVIAAEPVPEPEDTLTQQQRLRDFTTAY